jgi:multidrug efflux system outer membrane protein
MRRGSVGSCLAALACVVAGCASGPDYQPKPPAFDPNFVEAAGRESEPSDPAIATFWRGFNDAQLNALIEQALIANTDVKLAQARLQQARGNLGEAEANGLPSIGANAAFCHDNPNETAC